MVLTDPAPALAAEGDSPPFLSVMVVAWNVEAYIEECLESCAGQVPGGHEVIVVHNASSDATLAMAQRVADRHPGLFRIVDNERNVGLGEGRNQGMRVAHGRYWLFLDGDDRFQPDALVRIAEVLAARSPELLVINFARLDERTKAVTPSRQTHLLDEGWRNSVDGRRRLLGNFGSAWNKVYARDFVRRHGLCFPEGFFEDIVWNAECIMRAGSIYVIPDVLLHYRQRPGSILASTDVRHFDTIRQHRAIVGLLAREPALKADFGDVLRDCSAAQMFSTLHTAWQIPRRLKGRYLRQLVQTLANYDALLGVRRKRGRERAAATRIYPAYVACRWATKVWSRLKNRRSGAAAGERIQIKSK